MKKIRIAQIGTGHDHAPAAIQTLKNQSDLYELVGFAIVPEDSLNTQTASYENNKAFYEGVPQMTVEEILNDSSLDAVCIETEDRALTKYAILAAQKGFHMTGLGPRILRTETAPLFALACISCHFELFGL